MRARLLLTLGALLAAACGAPPEPRPPVNEPLDALRPSAGEVSRAAEQFATLATAFLAWYHEAYPVRATNLGLHAWDGTLPAYDRAAIQRRIDDLLDWLAQLDRVPLSLLEDSNRHDYAVLEFAIRAELLSLEEIRPWANDPRHYTGLVADGIASVAARGYAPIETRVAAIASRMGEAIPLLRAARVNLRAPPRIWTELALADMRGLLGYLRDDLPVALAVQGGGKRAAATLARPTADLIAALESHAEWLEGDLLPRATGDFRLGPYQLQRKLLYEEHIDMTVDELERLNDEKIVDYQARVAVVAAEIDPTRSPRAIMDSITRLHPPPEDLLPTARAMMLEAREWVRETGVVSLPTPEVPEVVETPPYARGGFASMDAPGPFSEPGLEAFYRITNVDPDWTAEQKRQHLSYFNYAGLLGVTVHETFPGHFLQLAFMRRVDSRIRKTFAPRSLTEGWAHYAEQLVLDEGFRDGSAAVRLGQLRRALQRHARWYAALHLHAFGETVEEVIPRYMEIAYFDEFPARREVIRATYDPTYLYYALGRIQILELRDDFRARVEEHGQAFSLRDFHDRFLALGLPISLAAEALLNPPRAPRLDPRSPRRRP
ncbi:MAG TPA: DUF885 domain-containing protein [Longimicrobiales bacterium]|nr:DUF885 domain-containing protein [Longimicrobiales bacterium]